VDLLISFIISLLASIIAVILTLYLERNRLPSLEIKAEEEGKGYRTYEGRGRWKFVRAVVTNEKMPFLLRWIGPRQTAENCKATLEFIDSNSKPLFTMHGRWASTPEIPQISKDAVIERVLYPDPVSIFAGNQEVLDVIVQQEGDSSCYGWNNEAYLNNWKTPAFKLLEGNYKVKINIITQNGVSFFRLFNLRVRKQLESTLLN